MIAHFCTQKDSLQKRSTDIISSKSRKIKGFVKKLLYAGSWKMQITTLPKNWKFVYNGII